MPTSPAGAQYCITLYKRKRSAGKKSHKNHPKPDQQQTQTNPRHPSKTTSKNQTKPTQKNTQNKPRPHRRNADVQRVFVIFIVNNFFLFSFDFHLILYSIFHF